MEIHGVPEYVIVNGRVCVDECELKAVHGFGKFVETPTFCNYVYDMIEEREKVYIHLLFVNKLESRRSMYTHTRTHTHTYMYTLGIFQRPRGVPRTEAEAKKYAEEDAAIAKAREAAKAAAAAAAAVLNNNQTNGTHESSKPKLASIECIPTLPDSAIMTPSSKGPRLEGQRNLQDSTFSISGK